MLHTLGHFVWFELMTTDASAAADFYCSVIGWTAQDSGLPNVDYTLLSGGGMPVAGLMEMPEQVRTVGARPRWTGYVAVDDVDAVAGRLEQSGGAIHRPPADIPSVGRFAIVTDPQGAVFALFKPEGGSTEAAPPPGATPGRIGWHELHADDLATAFGFYADLFGWTKADAVDMGPMGVYQMFAVGSATIGGMMTRLAAMPQPTWTYYVNVDIVSAAVERIRAAGGQVVNGPHQVPGGTWIAQALDPQGAMFAIAGPAG